MSVTTEQCPLPRKSLVNPLQEQWKDNTYFLLEAPCIVKQVAEGFLNEPRLKASGPHPRPRAPGKAFLCLYSFLFLLFPALLTIWGQNRFLRPSLVSNGGASASWSILQPAWVFDGEGMTVHHHMGWGFARRWNVRGSDTAKNDWIWLLSGPCEFFWIQFQTISGI